MAGAVTTTGSDSGTAGVGAGDSVDSSSPAGTGADAVVGAGMPVGEVGAVAAAGAGTDTCSPDSSADDGAVAADAGRAAPGVIDNVELESSARSTGAGAGTGMAAADDGAPCATGSCCSASTPFVAAGTSSCSATPASADKAMDSWSKCSTRSFSINLETRKWKATQRFMPAERQARHAQDPVTSR
jgi:hypothetical protein